MAHVILFTDTSPDPIHRYGKKLNSIKYNQAAGAYKIASVIRDVGLNVVVIPNCLSLTFKSVKKIIDDNKENLLWVGISTSLMTTRSKDFNKYRQEWQESNLDFIDPSLLFDFLLYTSIGSATSDMPWAEKEITLLSEWLKQFDVPLILGGARVTEILNGGIGKLHENTYVVRGNAEVWAKDFTLSKLNDRQAIPPYVNNNAAYDDTEFKHSTIRWEHQDIIDKDDWLPLEVGRGCAFNCSYCNYEHKGKFDLYKKPNVLLDELKRNWEMFGVTKYMLVDDLYNDSKEKVRILYDQVWSKLPFDVEWTGYMRLDMFWADPGSIEILAASGARYGLLGIETLHDKAGKTVGKGLGKTRILETLQNLKETWKNKVLVNGNFIAGLPHEPYEHIQEIMNWSSTTDLLHSVTWNPLFIARPEVWRHNETLNSMGKNNEKYGISWNGKSWINNMGLTFPMVSKLVTEYYEKNPNFRVNYSIYSDLRAAGLTHDEIIDVPKIPIEQFKSKIEILGDNLEVKVRNRLKTILKINETK